MCIRLHHSSSTTEGRRPVRYLIARDAEKGEPRTSRMDRIARPRVPELRFRPDPAVVAAQVPDASRWRPLIGRRGGGQPPLNSAIAAPSASATTANRPVPGMSMGGTSTLPPSAGTFFAVASTSAHRFSEYHVTGEHEKLAGFVANTVRWTFWPSLILAIVLVVLGKFILSLFGDGFTQGYPLLCVLVIGLVVRSSIGPSERLLNMIGRQKMCAVVYAGAFATNLVLCFVLIPRFGLMGAAIATVTAILLESGFLILAVRKQLGINVFVFARR